MRIQKPLKKLFYASATAFALNGAVEVYQEHKEEQAASEIGPWTIYINDRIDEEMSQYVINELQAMHDLNPHETINIHFNSRGGYVVEGFKIIEAINETSNPIRAVCTNIDSMAFIIFATAKFETRYVQPNCHGTFHMSYIPVDYTEEELEAGAPANDKITLTDFKEYLQYMDDHNIDEMIDMNRTWDYSVSRRFATAYIDSLTENNRRFSTMLAASSHLTVDDIVGFGYDDIKFNAEQLLWSGVADEYIGFESPTRQIRAGQKFCEEYQVSICPD